MGMTLNKDDKMENQMYQDIKDKQYYYNEIEIYSWSELINFFRRLTGNWIFRGQPDSKYSLTTSLERAIGDLRQSELMEEQLFREFQRRAHHYFKSDDEPRTDFEWFSLMQHNSVPTRLLDWTRSPYIASYFALDQERNGAIWAIDFDWCEEKCQNVLKDF